MTTEIDPFDFEVPENRVQVLRRGRYYLPHRDGSKKSRGWMRVSNLVSAYSDQFGLRMWELGEVIQGMCMDPALYQKARDAQLDRMERNERKEWVEAFIEAAKEVSGGNAGSKHGNMRHAAVETQHAGLPTGHLDQNTRRALSLYQSALERHGLVALPGMQERIVLVEALEVCGRLDNIVGEVCQATYHAVREPCPECFNNGWTNPAVGDLKTQKRFWTWLEIGAQFACYAHGDAMWDPAAERWVDMPPVSREVGFTLWMPRERPDAAGNWVPAHEVDVYEVDLVKGWATAQRAYEVVQDRAAAKSVKGGRAWRRNAPYATLTEQYAARFAAVDTLEDGRRLVAQARAEGVWGPVLADCAQQAYARIVVPA